MDSINNAKTIEKSSSKPSSKDKRKTKVNHRRLITLFVVVSFFVYFIYTLIQQQITISKNSNEIDALEERIAVAEQQKAKLEQELENLNDPEYLEKVAREKLGLVRPNERVFVDANQSDVNQSN